MSFSVPLYTVITIHTLAFYYLLHDAFVNVSMDACLCLIWVVVLFRWTSRL